MGKATIEKVFKREAKRNGFWLGNPSEEAKSIYMNYFGIEKEKLTDIEKENLKYSVLTNDKVGMADIKLAKELKSDLMWFSPEHDFNAWVHPERKPMWDAFGGKVRESLGDPGVFGDVEEVSEIDAFDWPDIKYLDFSSTESKVDDAIANDMAVFGGMWCPFFHVLCDFFGMENYFIKMYTNPDVVLAATEHVVDFYLQANKKCFEIMGDRLTSAFFGNDFGSQLSCLISPEQFDIFIKPFAQKLIDQMKSFGLFVTLHSCGSVIKLIPRFIDMGVDCVHPLQAKAVGMQAENLVQFKNDIVFLGGVDTQDILPFGTPTEVRDEVHRLRDLFGDNCIISPSHEALLPNVSIENVIAMSEAATD